MLIVTNYPQVPLATTNVATDLARADNQQAKPILPPQALTKPHHERALNQKNESLFRLNTIEEKHRQQRQSSDQQNQQHLSQQSALQQQAPQSAPLTGLLPQLLRVAARNNPTVSRRDIQPQTPTKSTAINSDNNKKTEVKQQIKQHSDEFYKQFGQHIATCYQQCTTPSPLAHLLILV
ncbi:hypothetical protein Q4557_06575 [Shewanella sp. 5_MG-2023]|uniref:hypothetical protein n=1 Tax=Shewanella sp. 5_MG-2023 TaxID=3062656 RepID=UPI0026E19B90|nr:hypothetical protein [Shewanella sp. 5_MG-2023]MDO6639622.1 hypothetical protein [Shewanella sp. 5_MG-2023]